VTLVLLAVLIVIRVLLAATVMIVLVGLIVMLLVGHLVVIATTDRVRLIVTLVSRVMIVLAGLIAIHVLHVLQHKNARMKLRVALANVAQVAKCHYHQNVLVKIG
jgi:thiol:disulfide interchange protein